MAKVIGKIVGVIFLAIGYWLLMDQSFKSQYFVGFLFHTWLVYFLIYIGVGLLLYEVIEKSKILSFIFKKILVFPVISLIYFQYMIAPVLSIMLFLFIYFLPSMWILILGETYPIIEQYEQGIIYLLSILSVLFFAYRSNVVMTFFIDTFKTKLLRKHLEKYSDPSFTRIYTYFIMIAIYISYNFLTFSNINPSFIPSEMLNVIKEVFVTFVALDSLIQIHLSKRRLKTE